MSWISFWVGFASFVARIVISREMRASEQRGERERDLCVCGFGLCYCGIAEQVVGIRQ